MAIERVLCEEIVLADVGAALVRRVRKNKGEEWSTTRDGIADYRIRLLALQNFRCAYCQTAIWADQNGLRELDHVLPKDQSATCDSEKCKSGLFEDRHHTKGYEKFRFEPRNLVIACKQCNNNKGSFDPLAKRDKSISVYPYRPTSYLWVHPFFHKYSEHVEITPNWFYRALTDQGDYLIRACKLDNPEVLARRKMAEAYAAQSNSLTQCLSQMGPQCQNLSFTDCVCTLVSTFNVKQEDAETLVDAWFQYGMKVDAKTHERALKLTKNVQAKLTRKMAAQSA